MSFSIVRNDIALVHADALVNAANHAPVIGAGVDSRLHLAAGPGLLEARQRIGFIAPGEAAATAAFDLPARIVIHAVTPHWQGGSSDELALLRKAYDRCLELALRQGCQSIAFPLLAAGNHGFPREAALQTATAAFRDFLRDHDLDITLVVFDPDSFRLSCGRFREVAAFIDDRMMEDTVCLANSAPCISHRRTAAPRRADVAPLEQASAPAEMAPAASAPEADLQELLRHRDAGFAETLVRLIERSGKKNSEIYKRANVDKKLFSKIVNNINYHPSKPTALALAVALELDLEETKDLIGRAGFALSRCSKFDIIIEYFILRRCYDLFEINETLFSFDQVLLGG